MELETKSGYAFSTYFGVLLTTNTDPVLEVNMTSPNGTHYIEYRNQIFCDLFIKDPNFLIDVKINSFHYHFSQDDESSPYTIEMKVNLPYFPTQTLVSKCKKISNDSDELLFDNSGIDIDYDFENDVEVKVSLNSKFFTLYSGSNTMKLPMIYLYRYQVLAFKPNLTHNQITKAYQQMTASLKSLIPSTLND